MNRIKSLIIITAAAVCVCTGCTKSEFTSQYSFPEENLLTTQNDRIFIKGFAADLCVSESDGDVNTDNVNAAAFGLFDISSGTVVSQHNIYDRVYPASTTKILTCLIALEMGNPDDVVTIPKESGITVSGSSMADLKPGDKIRLSDLLYALMVPSGNDAAVAIAHYISGDTAAFAEVMNNRAKELGAVHSHFTNPHGLPDDDHYTTVYDMYLIFNEAIRNEEFVKIAGTAEYSCTVTNDSEPEETRERTVSWTCGNGFLNGKFDFAENMNVLCGKTGHTSKAGFCLVLGETDTQGDRYISIMMNSPVYEQLYAGMRNLAEKSRT